MYIEKNVQKSELLTLLLFHNEPICGSNNLKGGTNLHDWNQYEKYWAW